MRGLKVLLCSILSFLALFPLSTHAQEYAREYQSSQEKILSYNSQVTINKDGIIEVIENIYYDFGPNQRHGIYRTIPFIKTNLENKKFKLDIYDINVPNETFSASKSGENIKIKIGDANSLVSGKKLYTINYKVKGALTYFSDHDELYWNVTGNEWEVPIDRILTKIVLDTGAIDEITLTCYTGEKGSQQQDCTFTKDYNEEHGEPNIYFMNKEPLSLGQGITIVVGFPKGLVAVLEPKKYFDTDLLWLAGMAIVALISLKYQLTLIKNWWIDRSNLKNKAQVVSAWFEPPQRANKTNFSPAETAFLVNRVFDTRMLTSTIIQLAQRGFLKIKVIDKKLEVFGNKKIEFIKKREQNSQDQLLPFEKTVLEALFLYNTRSTVTTDELKKSLTFSQKIKKMYEQVSDSLLREKAYNQDPLKYHNKTMALLSLATFGAFLIPLVGLISGVGAWIIRNKSLIKTDLGIEKYSKAKSLLNFLQSQTERLDFQSHNQMFFEKLLPYASAFGVEKVWAERFKDLQFTQNDWYDGSNSTNSMFYATSFNSLNQSFYSMTTNTSSSGFSSGSSGGSSGGGGGGGGGGSW